MKAYKPQALRATAPFFVLAASAFILTVFVGLITALKVAIPSISHTVLAFERIRPLHTLFPIVGVLSGIFGWISFMSFKQPKKYTAILTWLSFALLLFFVSGASLSLLLGQFSGREYFSWPPIFSVPLLLSLFLMNILLFSRTQFFSKISPEGFWLAGFGLLFITLGLSESVLWLIPKIGENLVKNLTVQWHSIDTFFAGLNAFLYGIGVFILQKEAKTLRKWPLYLIAIGGLLFTFGHHHYVSPQPNILKILALIASMIGMFSFVKHFRIYIKTKIKKEGALTLDVLFRTVELWTIVSFGTGILFAIPQVNLVIHGTYLVVIHAMGSMIGVELVLVFAAGFSIFKVRDVYAVKRIKWAVKLLNISLVLMWILMSVVGLIKGFMRFNSDYYTYNNAIQPFLYLLPILGLLLSVAISTLSYELLHILIRPNKALLYYFTPLEEEEKPISKVAFASHKRFFKYFKK